MSNDTMNGLFGITEGMSGAEVLSTGRQQLFKSGEGWLAAAQRMKGDTDEKLSMRFQLAMTALVSLSCCIPHSPALKWSAKWKAQGLGYKAGDLVGMLCEQLKLRSPYVAALAQLDNTSDENFGRYDVVSAFRLADLERLIAWIETVRDAVEAWLQQNDPAALVPVQEP